MKNLLYHVTVTFVDIKALVRHYEAEVERWSEEEPDLLADAAISLDYWSTCKLRMETDDEASIAPVGPDFSPFGTINS